MDRSVIDHRGPEFAALTEAVRVGLRKVFGTEDGVPMLYPGSGTGAIEAALVNVLSPGERVLVYNYGVFSGGLAMMARKFGFEVDEVPLGYGKTIPLEDLEARLRADSATEPYRAVLVVHNETSTGVTIDVEGVRRAMDAAQHDALLIVDTVSSLASIEFLMDAWRVDVAVCGSQKGLMLPPGLGILCASPRAVAISQATLMLFGLREALAMLVDEEGLPAVYARHARLASAVRAAVQAWGLPIVCEDPSCYSNTITTVRVPEGLDSNQLTTHAREKYSLSLGGGIGELSGVAFRIGHLGALNELEVLATIAGCELTFADLGIGVEPGSGLLASQRTFLRSGVREPVGVA